MSQQGRQTSSWKKHLEKLKRLPRERSVSQGAKIPPDKALHMSCQRFQRSARQHQSLLVHCQAEKDQKHVDEMGHCKRIGMVSFKKTHFSAQLSEGRYGMN